MYVVTFYSFKGGVGRTMALANVALSLAQAGRKVLLVDFDLEAPGIETFEMLRPPRPTKGVVDFVTTYAKENATPDVRDYVYECEGIPDLKGKAWVMPAGLRDVGYGQRLAAIDWQKLYDDHDGYLMIEDLKAQWEEAFNPDYVFIDSRTGHTDVGGICTRQLPDAVVILFFPNEQNLLGLQKVVSDVRAEAESSRRKSIALHFVTSNVPDLDDEERILVDQFEAFKKTLGYGALSATIHHYPSLALLRQDVFALTHPRSRLAGEYRKLREEVVAHNLGDREGALRYLASLMPWTLREVEGQEPAWAHPEVGRQLQRIRQLHPKDGQILYRMALVQKQREKDSEVLDLLAEAESAGFTKPALYVFRAQAAENLGGTEFIPLIVSSVENVLASSEVLAPEFALAVSLLSRYRPKELVRIHRAPAFRALSLADQVQALGRFMTESWRAALPGATAVVLERIGAGDTSSDDDLHQLSLALIASGKFQEAVSVLEKLTKAGAEGQIRIAFNRAMASWGLVGRYAPGLFSEVVALDVAKAGGVPAEPDANYHQCLAIALCAAGDVVAARARAGLATHGFRERPRGLSDPLMFSAWRYLNVSGSTFLKDMAEVGRLLDGESVVPRFIRRTKPVRKRPGLKRPRSERKTV